MHIKRIIFISLFLCLLAGTALAQQVTVSMPAEEDVSAMALREKAMDEGFARAVAAEAVKMLPGTLDETRVALLKGYYLTRAKPYIQGYKIITSKITSDGVFIGLDVTVNTKTLRHNVDELGLFKTVSAPVYAVVSYPQDLDEQSMTGFQKLMMLTGVRPAQDAEPVFTLERGPENTYRAKLSSDGQEWVSQQKDMDVAWFNVWKRYFNHESSAAPKNGGMKLAVSGWFSPDAALEFDRVLRGWESAAQNVQLMELDMQSTGVSGSWELRPLNKEQLTLLLKSYLPQRGLTYQLSEGGAQ